MPFELFALLTAVGFAFSAIFIRLGVEGSNPQTGNFIVVLINFIAFALALFLVDFSRITPSWFWVAFLGAGTASPALSLFFMYRAIPLIGVASTSSLGNTNAIFGAVWAFALLGERPSVGLWIGIAFVVGGVLLISGGGERKGRLHYYGLPILSAVFFGLAHTLRKVGFQGVDSLVFGGFLQAAAACIAVPAVLQFTHMGQNYLFSPRSVKYFALAGASLAGAQYCILTAINMGTVSQVAPLVATTPLFGLILTYFFLGGRERLTAFIVVGAFLIVIGAVIVTSIG